MKKISFHTSEDRALELISFFNRNFGTCKTTYREEKIYFEFPEIYTDLIVQGIFHSGISIGMQVNLI